MDILAAIWTVTIGVLLVILGFNALIVVHEWGHFIVARLCGVRCEKFYIWFDFWGLKFCKFKWGNTEYGLGLFPLGGYLKMLGQEDNPGAIQAEIERAKQQTQAEEPVIDPEATVDFPPKVEAGLTPETGGLTPPAPLSSAPDEKPSIFAPDSYLSKSVPQRLAIIVAGVVMNFLFAIVCAAGAYMIGVKETVPTVGNVIAGSPAWEAGLQIGDRITAIDGKPSGAFRDVNKKMIAGAQTVQLTIDRQGESLDIHVSPRRRPGDLIPLIGVSSQPTLELFPLKNLSHLERYYPAESLDVLRKNTEQNPLRIEQVDGHAVGTYAEYQDAQLKKIGQPITCTLSGTDTEIPAIPMREIPVRFKMGTITAVLSGSDAAQKGMKPGDTLISVDGDADIDPLKLAQVLLRKVNAGQQTVETVIKKADGSEQTLALELAPIRFVPDGLSPTDPVGSTALGLSWNVEPVIAAVEESALQSEHDRPAIGDRVTGVELVNCEPLPLRKNSFSAKTNDGGFFFHSIGNRVDMPYIFAYLLQETQPRNFKTGEEKKPLAVRLTLESPNGDLKTALLPITESTDWFHLERGFVLKPDLALFKAAGWGDALVSGTAKTIEFSLLVYTSLNSLINGTVSPKALHGPVGIVEIMYKIAQGPWSEFLMLLCLVGANLAVVNLLPIPPLDGGHVLFLTYEGIFRRPPNELVQVILSYFGLFLIVLLLVWTVSLDLSCIPRW